MLPPARKLAASRLTCWPLLARRKCCDILHFGQRRRVTERALSAHSLARLKLAQRRPCNRESQAIARSRTTSAVPLRPLSPMQRNCSWRYCESESRRSSCKLNKRLGARGKICRIRCAELRLHCATSSRSCATNQGRRTTFELETIDRFIGSNELGLD